MAQKRLLLAFVVGVIATNYSFSQTLFQKSYHLNFVDQSLAVETLTNGQLVLAGSSAADLSGKKEVWVTRLNTMGEPLWSKNFSLTQSSVATALQRTSDGNLIVVYNTTGSSTTVNNSGWFKISMDGDIIWSKKAIGNSALLNIVPSASGGYLLCGQSFSISGGQVTGLVVRIGEDGAIQWSSVFGENGNSAVTDCWEDPSGFIHCCGFTSDAGGDKNGFWAKMGPDGALVGPVRRIGSDQADEFTKMAAMGTDRLLLTGYTKGFGNSAHAALWTVVTDLDGNLKFSKTFSLPEKDLVFNDLIALPGNQFLLAVGELSAPLGAAILMKLSLDLDQLFANEYKGGSESDALLQVIATTSGGFAATGTTHHNGDTNAYLVVTDASGMLDSDDCCPRALDIVRRDVMPETASFIPTQTAFYAVQNITFGVTDRTVTAVNLCQPIALDFVFSTDTICPGECVEIMVLDSTLGVDYSYEYQGGIADINKPGQVCHTDGPVLFVTRKGANSNCEKSLTKRVSIGSKKDHFPNAFTPNGDGANDVFKPVFDCPPLTMHFVIYNRWGKKVFETNDPNGGWEGSAGGADATSDVYAWTLEYVVEFNGIQQQINEKGEVTLLR
jgi:gliding motility-associated-like protein